MWLPAYLATMYNMIARLDDMAKFRSLDLNPYYAFQDYGLTAKLCWTKNTREERDSPARIFFGSRDWRYCVLLLLGVWLEYHFEMNPQENKFYFGFEGEMDPDSIKATTAYHLKKIMNGEDIKVDFNEVKYFTGTHSIRKFSCNKGRGGGLNRNETDHCSRWKIGDL